MSTETQELARTFKYNSVDLPDPGAQYTVEQVRDFYSITYPEITSASVDGPEEKGGKLTYTFRRAVGTKGADLRATLEAIAAGKSAPAANRNAAAAIRREFVREHANAFQAWHGFTRAVLRRGGEALSAPSGALTPLP